jgi:hypothetical protein
MPVSAVCRPAVLATTAIHLAGCIDEDRILTARCQVAGNAFAAATFSPTNAPQATIGGLNVRQEALGTLYQFARDRPQIGRTSWMAVYRLAAHTVNVSHEVYWNSLSLKMHITTDLDGEELSESSRASIDSVLLSGSAVVTWDVERQAITDALQAINEDPGALRILRGAAPEDRYLMVSSRLLAKYVWLYYTPGGGAWLSDGRGSVSTPFITPWTFRIGSTNFHSKYSCGTVDELNAITVATNERVPAVYFYTPVRYDPARGRVEREPRTSDLDLLTAVLGP